MYMNRPVGSAYPNLLGQTRPIGAAATTWIQPQAPYQPPYQAPGSTYTTSGAGPSIMANLQALGSMVWSALSAVFRQIRDTIQAQLKI